jgi:hypothetical protein
MADKELTPAEVLERARANQEKAKGPPAGFQRRDLGFALQKPGDEVAGVYLGEIAPRNLASPSGELRPVPFYRIQRFSDGATTEVIGAALIERFFEEVEPGQGVWIRRGGQKEAKSGRVNEYETAVMAAPQALAMLTEAGHALQAFSSYTRPRHEGEG